MLSRILKNLVLTTYNVGQVFHLKKHNGCDYHINYDKGSCVSHIQSSLGETLEPTLKELGDTIVYNWHVTLLDK